MLGSIRGVGLKLWTHTFCGWTWLVVLPLLVVQRVQADTYYVAPSGSDGAPGTEAQPFATLNRAQQQAQAGDTVLIRGGRYEYRGTAVGSEVGIHFDKSGRQGAPIVYAAYPNEIPVFDFTWLRPQARIKGFRVTGSWLHFRELEIMGVQQILTNTNESWAIRVEGGSNNVFERLNLHHNEGPGLFIVDGGNNLVLNVDSHHNYDPDRGGENADGFGCHSNDAGNVFRGCRAWYNSDDGYDFINSPGVCVVEYSWAFRNGYRPDSTIRAGNGAGFKGGGFVGTVPATIPRHVLRFNVAWNNSRQGFYANHHEGGLDFFHNTAFNNGQSNFDLLADEGYAPHTLRNKVAGGSGVPLANANYGEINTRNNTWDLGLTVSSSDFQSVSDLGTDGPRQADGSLPNLPFLKPAPGGRLVDQGSTLRFPYAGSAPDLGAFELGLTELEPGTGTGGGVDSGSGGLSDGDTISPAPVGCNGDGTGCSVGKSGSGWGFGCGVGLLFVGLRARSARRRRSLVMYRRSLLDV